MMIVRLSGHPLVQDSLRLTLHFKLMEGGLLSVKIFGHFGTRVRCCMESSSDDEDSSSSESGEEDNGSDDEGSGRQDGGSN